MDAPRGFNPYLELSQSERDNRLLDMVSNENLLAEITLLIKAGANVNVLNHNKSNPLMQAALQPNKDIVALLIKNGANLEGTSMANTPIVHAVINDHLQIVNLFIEKGIKIICNFGVGTPLYFALQKENKNMTYRLLCEVNSQQLEKFAKSTTKNCEIVANFNKERNNNKMKVYQMMMPFLLNMDSCYEYDTLPSELLKLISALVFQIQDGVPDWYQHLVKHDALEACMKFTFSKKKKSEDSISVFGSEELPLSVVMTPLHESKKRKAEDALEEDGRNKRRRKNQCPLSEYCVLQ